MLSDDVLRVYLRNLEADNVERTRATRDGDKFGEAICAFSNDLLDRRATGVLFVGVTDDGGCAGIDVDERLLQALLSFRTDGRILPPPSLTVRAHTLDDCRMVVVEVEPSDMPPLRFNGRVCVRAGPRRSFATPLEERRLTEKRRWSNLPFDQQPVAGATLADLDMLRFAEEYLPVAVSPDVLAENGRELPDQARAMGFLDKDNTPTLAGLLVIGKSPRDFVPGSYVQFVRYPDTEIGGIVQDQKEVDGAITPLLRQLDEIIAANNRRRAELSGPRQINRSDYPSIALQELVRNAIIHRTYEMTHAPVMLTWYDDRVEITSPGGLFGSVTLEILTRSALSDARNPAFASAAKTLGFVQKFGSGIRRAQAALQRNGNPAAEFEAEANYFSVTVRAAI